MQVHSSSGVIKTNKCCISLRLLDIFERLDDLDADKAETRAAEILDGLGFTPSMQQTKTKDFSGGWRMRIALARALFVKTHTSVTG